MKLKLIPAILLPSAFFIYVLIFCTFCTDRRLPESIKVYYQVDSPQQIYAISRLGEPSDAVYEASPEKAEIIVVTKSDLAKSLGLSSEYASVKQEGFIISKLPGGSIVILATDQTGAMYGIMDIKEQFQLGRTMRSIEEKTVNPATEFRGIKFNLPWNSYRTDQSLQIHESTIRDLNFWKAFLNMMADNRFNALTLWNLHPFTYMIRAKNFPEACPYSDIQLKEWQDFWHGLFRMASERGIRTYVFNWNIMVSSSFAEKYKLAEYCLDSYPGKNFIGKGDYSPIIQKYMRESVRELFEAYPELTGIG